jgi:hypothetical protein
MLKEEPLLAEDIEPLTHQPSSYLPNSQRVRSRRDDRHDGTAFEDWQHPISDRPATDGFDDRMSYTASYYNTEYSQGRASTYTSDTFAPGSDARDLQVFRESAAGDYIPLHTYNAPAELDQYADSAYRGRRKYPDHSEENEPQITYVGNDPYGRPPARSYDRYAEHW